MMKNLKPDWNAPAHIHAYTLLKDHSEQDLLTLLPPNIQPIWLKQTHSAIAVEAIPAHLHSTADASYSTHPRAVCVVKTADCLPLLICNRTGTKIAAIHAGWRGLAAGIIENTFRSLSAPQDEWLVWLGPAIGPKHFEVGLDVFNAFTTNQADAQAAFQALDDEKWLANLYLLAKQRLNQLGITDIYGGHYCTYSQPEYFHSYRREKENAG
jgi:polyphenol oxidase